ncbi:hypothetical protein ACFWBF_34670 [Streptomyces sp. NPDC060028]|uniref:hypothetical protein n=1 Tax=Streptomyces sp. NPDC060028 TaxID=3347041 RepID=UPI0036C16C21
MRTVHEGAVGFQPEGGRKNGGEICLGECGTHLSQDVRKVAVVDDTHVFLAQLENDLDELGPQPHPGAGRVDFLIDLVHEPAHDLVWDFHVSTARVEANPRLPCRVLVGNDRGHKVLLLGGEFQFKYQASSGMEYIAVIA